VVYSPFRYAPAVVGLAPLQAVAHRDDAALGGVCLDSLERAGLELEASAVLGAKGVLQLRRRHVARDQNLVLLAEARDVLVCNER